MLLLCATPIGNLGDLTPRVKEALTACSAIYCEDTRRTLALLHHCGVKKPLISCHRHNELQRAAEIAARVQAGETIVYVSDAGMPGVSDPGEALLRACVERNLPVSVLPGASAVLTAAVLSGLPPMPFSFYGFFPREKKKREALLASLRNCDHLVLFYESPNRVSETLQALLAALGDLDAALMRELTKLHEEAVRGPLSALAARYAAEPPRGECVLAVLCRAEREAATAAALDETLTRLLGEGLSVRDASAAAALFHDLPKKAAYERALALAGKR